MHYFFVNLACTTYYEECAAHKFSCTSECIIIFCVAWILKCQYIFFYRDAETANNTSSSNNQQQQQTSAAAMPNSPQKPGGFRLFQSSNNSSNNSGNNQPPQSSTSNAQPNGILKNSYDRDAMSRVGQRYVVVVHLSKFFWSFWIILIVVQFLWI